MTLPTKNCDLSPVTRTGRNKTMFTRALGAGIGLSCAVIAGSERFLAELASASGVHVTLTPKTASDFAPSGLTIDGYLFPRTTTSGSLTFDGRLSYFHVGSQYNFTLLEGRGYVTVHDESTGAITTNQCLSADNIPPISTFANALLDARVIDDGSAFNVECSGGNVMEFMFAVEPYVFCSKAGVSVSSIVGEDIKAAFELLSENSKHAPSVDSLTPASLDLTQCGLLETDNASTSSSSSSSFACGLLEKTVQRSKGYISTTCGCTDGLKTCLFVHGLGWYDGETTDSFSTFWGDIEQRQQCCSNTKFIHVDTDNKTWYDDALTDKLCAVAAEVSGSANASLKNLAIVAYSMGNLITASAFSKETCTLASSSKYIAMNGPIYRSMTATTAVKIFESLSPSLQTAFCSNTLLSTSISNPLITLLTHNSVCPVRTSLKSIAYMGSSLSTAELDEKYEQAAKACVATVGANLCGVSPVGLLSSDSTMMTSNGLLSGHASSCQVEITSCRTTIDLAKYSTSYDGGSFYKVSINHLDGTFRHGDGFWGADRKPVKWLNCQF